MQTKVLKFNISYEKLLLLVSSILLAVFLIGYIYYINAGVLSVVTRKQTEEKVAIVSTKVSELESNYLSIIEDINPELAISMGLKEPTHIRYVDRKSLVREFVSLRR